MQDFLTEELGLSPEVSQQILDRVLSIEQERDSAQEALSTLNAAYAAHRMEAAVSRALADAGAKNLTAAGALIDKSALTEEEDGFLGLSEQVARIKKECGYLFYGGEAASGMRHAPAGTPIDSFTQFARTGAKLN